MTSISSIVTVCNKLNIAVTVSRYTNDYMRPNCWHVGFVGKNEHQSIEGSASGDDFELTFLEAWSRLEPLFAGIPAMREELRLALAPPAAELTDFEDDNLDFDDSNEDLDTDEIPF